MDASGWIVADGQGKRFRTWKAGFSAWTDDRDKATRYARREDAEAVHQEDEDAWLVMPYDEAAFIRFRLTQDATIIERDLITDDGVAHGGQREPIILDTAGAAAALEQLHLPCAVRLPSGTTFGPGVSLGTFLLACNRQFAKDFPPPPKGPDPELKDLDTRELLRQITDKAEGSIVEAHILTEALRQMDWDIVLRKAMTKLPHTHQLDMCQTMLANLGMVAVRSEYIYPDDKDAPVYLVALRDYARGLGFVLMPSGPMSEIEDVLRQTLLQVTEGIPASG